MSSAANPDASRSGKTATGTSSNRAGRLDGRAWRDVERALRLGRKHEAHSVECHGVRFVFRCVKLPQVKHPSGRAAEAREKLSQEEQPRGSAEQGRNHAQCKSAARMRNYIEAKKAQKGSGSAQAPGPSAAAAPASTEPAPVESDARTGDTTMAEAEAGCRGQKRAVGESPACEPQPTALPHSGQQAKRPAESTGRYRRPGLMPLNPTPEEDRRSGAELALESRRGGRTLEG